MIRHQNQKNKMTAVTNTIFGFSAQELTPEEITFFMETNPCGYILFKRNVATPEQVKRLTEQLKSLNNNPNLLILIDQEGGRVRRLRPPHFREAFAAGEYVKIAEQNFDKALKAVELNHYLMGRELNELGINVDCAPVADLKFNWAHEIIGDRSFGEKPEKVAALCKAAITGLNGAGVHEVIKHIPGHGRALADSHEALPIVTTTLDELEKTDFSPFKSLNSATFAMTAHVVFEALDQENCVTHSSSCLRYIRERIGFSGLIMCDDLSMNALKGSLHNRAAKALAAGCDLLLHCNGNLDEMVEVAKAAQEFGRIDQLQAYNQKLKTIASRSTYKNTPTNELELELQNIFNEFRTSYEERPLQFKSNHALSQ
jgi:beta-N-acetylhexosaminidase